MPYRGRRRFTNNRQSGKLRRMYGFFECDDCDRRWESSHVYCKEGTYEAAYGQECQECKVMCKPHRVERLKCVECHQTICECEERHIDPGKNHRSDLCGKCKAGRPCY